MNKKAKVTYRDQPKFRILIVDDHPLVRRGLRELIQNEPDLEVCGDAAGATEALQMLDATNPDLVIIDIFLKEGHGIELIKQIKARNERVKMLVSSMHDEALYAERVLRAGAMGYINKQEASDNVLHAVRQVLRGKVYLSAKMTERMLRGVLSAREATERPPIDRLTDRELEVFELIGQGLTARQIANQLHLSVKTIETHRENIKTKFNIKSAAELSRHAMQWVLEES